MMLKRLVFWAVCVAGVAMAATAEGQTVAGTSREDIRTLQTSLNGNDFAYPVINLGSDDRLTFSFDHIADDRSYFRYRLTHCNADWKPSGLLDSEILEGFNEGTIDDYSFSTGTTVNYVHYRFTLPNGNMEPLVSGNYTVEVYDEAKPDETVARWRFMVSEQVAKIGSQVSSRTDVDTNKGHQQISITVDTDRTDVTDPFNDLSVTVQQNGRWDNEVSLRHPLRMSGRKAIYEHLGNLVFKAGNEYRRFETVSLDYPGMNVNYVEFLHPYYHVVLQTDAPRGNIPYSYDSTQRGRFRIREFDSDYADTAADYAIVHFALDMPKMDGHSVFIDGDLTNRRLDSSSAMTYNEQNKRYEKALLLKQGSYNYQYIAVPNGNAAKVQRSVEGDHYQTVNEYLIKVYTRRPGERYDRLIGVSNIIFDK